ncbi:MAG: FAD-dependent monooxygenase [Gammaproteobacteria bacterium]
MDTDVLIVGAGPTGLMLANQLARRGVRAIIVDRHAGPSKHTRALGVQARTMEIYSQLGIVDRARELGKVGAGADIWARGRHMARVPLGSAGKDLTPYPYIFILGQDDNERILGDRLHDWGLAVQWNTELIALDQQAGRVVATLKRTDGTRRTISAAWVAGCDGAQSAVRELNRIGFPGAPYEHVFFVADANATGTMVPDEVNVYLLAQGFHLFFPMRGQGHWRIVGILPTALRGRQDLAFDDVIPLIRAEAGAGLTFQGCSWFSTYRIHHRAAARFRDRRCFLLGDAAHIHSPVGAQGMNTGLQDAYNLAWKLALVVAGAAAPALLDTYEEERLPVARRLLATTDRAFRLIVSDSWLAALLRTQVLARIGALALKLERVQTAAFRTVSQLGIHYRASSLSRATGAPDRHGPQPGDRFPWLQLRFSANGPVEDSFQKLDDTRFNLLLFGQPMPDGVRLDHDGLFAVHAIPVDAFNENVRARAKIAKPSFYLLRPDGHVGLRGGHLDVAAISRYASEWLRVPASAGGMPTYRP